MEGAGSQARLPGFEFWYSYLLAVTLGEFTDVSVPVSLCKNEDNTRMYY